jgi:hypothetical protein
MPPSASGTPLLGNGFPQRSRDARCRSLFRDFGTGDLVVTRDVDADTPVCGNADPEANLDFAWTQDGIFGVPPRRVISCWPALVTVARQDCRKRPVVLNC